jgi:hypothetical protein
MVSTLKQVDTDDGSGALVCASDPEIGPWVPPVLWLTCPMHTYNGSSYPMDSHIVQRFNDGSRISNEGAVWITLPRPYPVSYRSIVPKQGEAENLLVTLALSSSHSAFASNGMEPVILILS